MSANRQQRAYSRLETAVEFLRRASNEEFERAGLSIKEADAHNRRRGVVFPMVPLYNRGPFHFVEKANECGYYPRLVWVDE